ncbi:hypothetical protein [Microvirga subterranea]|uniref:Uncharacterized protein n=1 Tax=Microvirga subterranea TaxID=186651 RepID=A0A370HH01_9HYPH|nr:hypothetical protein [Microvirga subterranea]RDI57170.1 hypothetical protein DES45_10787 [Microvirga subterranea]
MTPSPNPLPIFIPSPGGTDYLLVGMAIFLVAFMLAIGLLYLTLHHLPDHIAHKSQKVQYEIVGVLGLLAMFTHVHAFWIAGLLLALTDLPDFGSPLRRMAGALDRIAAGRRMVIEDMDGKPTRAGPIMVHGLPTVADPESKHVPDAGAGAPGTPREITGLHGP